MKFLCDQCKAKYQISDDKVAGKTVRMKCRKCGHQIEVRAAVTETSVSTSMPPPDNPPATMGSGGAGAPAPPRPAAPGSAPKPPAAPRPSALATSLSAARPAAPRPPTKPAEGALAGAFTSAVQKHDEAAQAMELLELSSADEWYVAINGVPVGPVRMTELRRKAALGAVTDESLVWQDGLEEWRIVRSIPELSAIVREAASSGRVSLTPEPPPGRASVPPPGPSPSMRPGARSVASAPHRAPEPPRPAAARSNVVPITSRLATAERLDEAPLPMDMPPAPERFSIAPDPFAIPPAPAAPTAIAAPMSIPPPAPIERRGSPPPWIGIAIVVLAGGFGITAAIAIFFRPQQAPQQAPAPVVIQVPAPATAAAPATPTDTSEATPSPSASTAKGGPIAKGGPASGAKAAPTATGPTVDPSIAALLKGSQAGPSAGGGGGGGGGGGSLTSDQIEGVVRNHSLAVRRTCWERGGSQASSANITVMITVGGSGAVQNASATGNEPTVAKCIEGAVRGWQFPPTGGTSQVQIPFHFVRQ